MNGRDAARRTLGVLAIVALLFWTAGTVVLAQANTIQKIRYGEVVSMQPTIVKLQPTGSGATIGATAGAVAGYALADRGDRWLGGLLGGVLGGAAGKAAERASKKKKGWELIIAIEGGEEIGIQVPGKKQQYRVGDRVRLMSGQGGQTKVSKVS